MEKQLPRNIEAEQALLGKLIVNGQAILLISDQLAPSDFYRDAHRTIYETMLRLLEQAQEITYITVADALERAGVLEDVGGAGYLASLIDTPDAHFGDTEHYARVLARKSLARQLIFAAGRIAALGYDEDEEMLPRAEAAIFEVMRRQERHEAVPIEELALDYLDEVTTLRAQPHGSIVGVPTGFRQLDFLTGGLQRSDFIVVAGRPSMGKTAFALALALHAARCGKRSLFFSLEMSKRQLMQRLTSMLASVNLQNLRIGRLSAQEWERVDTALSTLAEMADRLLIDDSQGLTPLEVRARSLMQHKKRGLDLVVVDYLQRMEARINGKRITDRVQEVSDISNKLKSLSGELDVPLLALAQLSREPEKRQNKRPQLSDLNESGKIEQDADVVAFLYRQDYYAKQEGREGYTPTNLCEVLIAKHRNGDTCDFSLYFDAQYTRFHDIEAR